MINKSCNSHCSKLLNKIYLNKMSCNQLAGKVNFNNNNQSANKAYNNNNNLLISKVFINHSNHNNRY